jgi:ATP-dependent protease HslVU (ClpYQ) ATPase subunit
VLEINVYYSGRSTVKQCKEDGNEYCIPELSNEDEDQDEGHSDSSAAEEKASDAEEKKDKCLDEEESEQRSAVMRMHAGFAFVDEIQKWMDQASRGDDKRQHI